MGIWIVRNFEFISRDFLCPFPVTADLHLDLLLVILSLKLHKIYKGNAYSRYLTQRLFLFPLASALTLYFAHVIFSKFTSRTLSLEQKVAPHLLNCSSTISSRKSLRLMRFFAVSDTPSKFVLSLSGGNRGPHGMNKRSPLPRSLLDLADLALISRPCFPLFALLFCMIFFLKNGFDIPGEFVGFKFNGESRV